ncbi:MAG: hypothetical protein NTW86_01065, partial [Candidatus Sumerlaeota bacterium]|nr:hypothetical protein [Candidatus Sumerlaeota bacterium]
IAVPNFLEAQTRSKVARVKADMRSLATAIEAYTVDWNLVMGTRDIMDATGLAQQKARLVAYSRLTTPVAYITAIPRDPFQFGNLSGNRADDVFQFQASNSFSKKTGNAAWYYPRLRGYTWVLNSLGPNLRAPGPNIIEVLRGTTDVSKTLTYDPTNGTVSEGYIIRTNKGDYVVDLAPAV